MSTAKSVMAESRNQQLSYGFFCAISVLIWLSGTLEFMLSAKRDARAAERFFRKAMKATHNQGPNGQSPVAYGGRPAGERWTHRE